MSSLTIYKFGTIVARATVQPDTTSQQSVTLMGEDVLVINFEVPTPISFQIGDYCHFMNKLYQVNKYPKRTRKSTRRLQYTIQLEAEYYDLGKVQFLFLDANNNFTEPVFSLRGTLQDFGDLIIHNLKRVFPTANWILGFVNDTDYKTLDFTSQNCLQVLQTVVQAFNTEYIVDAKTINLYQRNTSSGLVLQYGKNKSLLSLTEADKDASNVITRLYAFGSTRNITSAYRGGAQRLRLGAVDYIERNVALYRVNEFTMIFDGSNGTEDIYPHRTGTVSAVDDPFNFYDSGMDFDVNANLITGTTAQIVFNTGLLSGYTFDLNAYNNGTKKFTINPNTTDPNITVPSVTLTPAIGDTYVIINITLPDSYVAAAEAALRVAALNYIAQFSLPPVVYSGTCNPKYFKDFNKTFNLGESAQVLDTGLNINKITRITAYTRNFVNIFDISMVLSDTVAPNSIIVKLLKGL